MTDKPILAMTRENLESRSLARLVAERQDDETQLATDEQLLATRRAVVPDDADTSDIWVFGYGSLMFNPVIDYVEQLQGTIYGHHRRFCLWTRLGRGSPDFPGLVLALDRGGCCPGIAFRLNPEVAIAELDLLWRREMVTLSYRASWLTLHTARGKKRAIGFVARPDRPNYAAPMPIETEVETIARASGFLGPCREYLFNTVKALRENRIHDPHLEKLTHEVELRLARGEGVG